MAVVTEVRADEVHEVDNQDLLQDDAPLKRRELACVPIRITRMSDPKQTQYGISALIDYETLESGQSNQDGESVPDTGATYVDGRIMRALQGHFLRHPKQSVTGMFVLSPIVDGKRFRGWQFVRHDAELSYGPEGEVHLEMPT